MTRPAAAPFRLHRRLALLPAAVFLLYLATTVVLFAWGPWRWPLPSRDVFVYLALALLAFVAGTALGARLPTEPVRLPTRGLVPLAATVVLVNLIVLPLTYRASTGEWLPHLWSALREPGEVYLDTWRLRESASHPVWYLRILFGPLIALLLPLVVVERKRLPRWLAALGMLLILGDIAIALGTGTNRLFGHVSVLLPWLLLAGHLSRRSPFASRREVAGVVFALLVLWGGFAWFFQRTMASRDGAPAQTAAMDLDLKVAPPAPAGGASSSAEPPGRTAASPRLVFAALDHPLVALLPVSLRTGVLGITSYLSQGYFALSLALEKPFVPMWGAGHSMFLTRQVERLPAAAGFSRRSYPARIEQEGWDAYGRFSSVFPWLASDVGFGGALLVLALAAAGLTASWRDLLGSSGNPFAAAAFAQLVLFVAYVPANNQCLQSGETLTAFWALIGGWLLCRRRR